jgi:hypothetical protein
MRAVALKRPSKSNRLAELPGARPARYPGFIAPCDPTLRERAPQGPDWLHEIKIDGYRAQLHIHDGRVRVFSRSGYDWPQQFAQIARAAEALSTRDGSRTLIVAELATSSSAGSRPVAWRKITSGTIKDWSTTEIPRRIRFVLDRRRHPVERALKNENERQRQPRA